MNRHRRQTLQNYVRQLRQLLDTCPAFCLADASMPYLTERDTRYMGTYLRDLSFMVFHLPIGSTLRPDGQLNEEPCAVVLALGRDGIETWLQLGLGLRTRLRTCVHDYELLRSMVVETAQQQYQALKNHAAAEQRFDRFNQLEPFDPDKVDVDVTYTRIADDGRVISFSAAELAGRTLN